MRTRPYIPRTNGEAERFVQTSLKEWAYAKAYETSEQRRSELGAFLVRYNWHKAHRSLRAKPPISRLGLSEDNLLRLHNRLASPWMRRAIGFEKPCAVDRRIDLGRRQRGVP